MRRLYLRIYLAVVASLAVFALAAALLWLGFAGSALGLTRVAALLQNVLSSPGASVTEQQTVLERALRGLDVDASLFAADGAPLASVGAPLRVPEKEGWQGTVGARPVWALRLPDGRWLAARMPHERRGPGAGLLALALILVAVGVGTYPVVRGLTQRLERLQAGVESLGAGELSARAKVEGDDEVARLAESFNRAAARIEQLVGAHKSLLAGASHELRTPLARIRMAVELTTKGAAAPERKRELEKDIAELDEMIDEILLASRLEVVRELEAVEEVDLLALAAEECARYGEVELDGQPATVRGDPRLLRRLIRNLLENARRHGAPPIGVRVSGAPEAAGITVCDHGPGVPQAERDRVFEPFYRLAGSSGGAGIGLSLVREIARRHGGEARCEGNCFSVTLKTLRF